MPADLPIVPPEWIALRAASEWLEQSYGAEVAAAALPELILAVRERSLSETHRIDGAQPRHSPRGTLLPTGLDYERYSWSDSILPHRRIVATDWEAANTNWRDGTVGGWEVGDGRRERLPIELSWEAITRFMSMILPRLKRQGKSAAATEIAQQPKQEPKSQREALADALVSLHQEKRIDLNTHAIDVVVLGKMADERVGTKQGSSRPTVERALRDARARIAGS
jgi:hypothetical protein